MSNDNRNELARILLRADTDLPDAEFIEHEAANPWRNKLAQADAILAAGYHTTPNDDAADPEPQFSDGPDFYAEHHAWSRRNEVGYGHNRSASVLPYPENKEHTL